MADRTVEDRLREEYFNLLPEIRRVAEFLDVQIRHRLLEIRGVLEKFEQVEVRSRVKECESAITSLRVRQEGSVFYADRLESETDRLRRISKLLILLADISNISSTSSVQHYTSTTRRVQIDGAEMYKVKQGNR